MMQASFGYCAHCAHLLIQKEGVINRGDADLVEYMSATSAGPWTRSSAETQPASTAFVRERERRERKCGERE